MAKNYWLAWAGIWAAVLTVGVAAGTAGAADPLASWNDGPAKKSITDFVAKVTSDGSGFVPVEERIACFDNDGTLWCEQPVYVQVVFALDRVKELAAQHPDWKTAEPYKSILADDREAISKFTIQDFEKVVAATHTGMTVEEFQAEVKQWLAAHEHPRFHRRYTELVYQPMLELLAYLRANRFKTYIVTGGGQEFVRVFAETGYGVVPEQVIGSASKTKYEYGKNDQPMLVKLPEVLLIDDKVGKPEAINLIIGRRPLAAFGNSTGDQQMLEWTQGGGEGRLMLLVHHDDAKREYAYGPDSKVGTFTDALMNEANGRQWIVVSMKDDWKKIFPFENDSSDSR
jgi:phosphoglycolate phosphatase-like HAD superfamily hydrolase